MHVRGAFGFGSWMRDSDASDLQFAFMCLSCGALNRWLQRMACYGGS